MDAATAQAELRLRTFCRDGARGRPPQSGFLQAANVTPDVRPTMWSSTTGHREPSPARRRSPSSSRACCRKSSPGASTLRLTRSSPEPVRPLPAATGLCTPWASTRPPSRPARSRCTGAITTRTCGQRKAGSSARSRSPWTRRLMVLKTSRGRDLGRAPRRAVPVLLPAARPRKGNSGLRLDRVLQPENVTRRRARRE